jgi:hypothetical protein
MSGITALGLLVGVSLIIAAPIILKIRKIFLQIVLQQRVDKLRYDIDNQSNRCNAIRALASDYFNSVGPATHKAIGEMDGLLSQITNEINDIEQLIKSSNSRNLKLAKQKLNRFQGIMCDAEGKEVKFRQPTWEYKVDDLVKRTGADISEASQKAKSSGVSLSSRNRKSTSLVLHEIDAVDGSEPPQG